VAIALALALIAPAAAASGNPAPGAVLDPGFGDGGVVKLPSESTFAAYGTATGGGGLLVSGGSSVQLLNDAGGTGEAFGGVGSLTLPAATGDEFQLGDFAIDAQGRLVVVGSSLLPESENPSPYLENGAKAFYPAALRILRFLPDGGLDPSFGRGGVVETELGLPAPVGTKGEPLGTHAALRATGITVDRQGRIVVTGAAVTHLGPSCVHDSFAPEGIPAGFVARFLPNGTPDPGFGRGGLLGGHGLGENPLGAASIREPIVTPDGTITYLSGGAYRCERGRSHLGIAQLTPDGRTRRAFGRKGAIVGPYRTFAEEPDGSFVALAEVPRRREKESFRARVIRITPDGRREDSFGRDGQATVRLGPGFGTSLDSLAVDGQGRILVGGTLGTGKGRSIVLLRVSAGGRWQRNFGPHGRVAKRVSRLSQFGAGDLFFDPAGRLVTVHLYTEPLKGSTGLVVARYLLRN
jgi:hypothetical protein